MPQLSNAETRTESAVRIVTAGLRSGEELLWTGRPATRWVFEPLDWWCLSCGLPAGIAWPFIMGPLFSIGFPPGIAFWLFGIALCVWPMIDWRLGRAVYVLTNQRAFILWELFGRPYREVELNSSRVEVQRLRLRRPGTVTFLPRRDLDRIDRALMVMRHYSFDFAAVDDAMAVQDMIKAARAVE